MATALIVIDIQKDYFPGGAFEQEGADAAAARSQGSPCTAPRS